MFTESQLLIIGIAASVIVWVFKQFKQNTHSGWLSGIVFAAALVLAWLWNPAALPQLPAACSEIAVCVTVYVDWAGALIASVSAFVGFATLVYNAVLKSVLDKYGAPIVSKIKFKKS